MDVYDNNYVPLVRVLPADAMMDDFVGKGLLRDSFLHQKVEHEGTNIGKMRLLLNDIKRGVSVRSNDSFRKLLEAMKDYGDYSKDQAVLDLTAKIRLELPDADGTLSAACS